MRRPASKSVEDKEVFEAERQTSADSSRANTSLRAGDRAPNFRLANANGQIVSLASALKHGPAVVSFLHDRSGAPTAELEALQALSLAIDCAWGTILALSPESVQNASSYDFDILRDLESRVANAYGLSTSLGILAGPASDNREFGRVGTIPATFIIDQRSRIVLSLVDVGFDNELVPQNVVCALRAMHRRQRTQT